MKSFKKALFDLPLPQVVKKDIIALEIAKKYWKKVVGDEVSNKTRPYCVSHGTLVIEVEDSLLAQVISLNSLIYLEKLNKKSPSRLKPLFKQIKLRIAPGLSTLKKDNNLANRKISLKEIQNYFNACKIFKDKELKKAFEALTKAYVKCYLKSLGKKV